MFRWTYQSRKYYIYHMIALYVATEAEAAAARAALSHDCSLCSY